MLDHSTVVKCLTRYHMRKGKVTRSEAYYRPRIPRHHAR